MKRTSKGMLLAMALAVATPVMAGHHGEGHETKGVERAQRMIDRMDGDGDGFISLDEFREPPRAWSRFDVADANGDGEVTLPEIEAAISERADEQMTKARAMFSEADQNGDGVVTEFERKSAAFTALDGNGDGLVSAEEMQAHAGKRGPRRPDRPRRPNPA